MIALIQAHPYGFTISIYYVFSAGVSSMPAPDSTSGNGYVWLFKFLHMIAGDISAAFASKLPQIPLSLEIAQTATKQAAVGVQAAQAAISDAKASASETPKP